MIASSNFNKFAEEKKAAEKVIIYKSRSYGF